MKTANSRSGLGQSSVFAAIVLSGVTLACGGNALAQIIPDNTLGPESSVVVPLNPQVDEIGGGALRGTRLFHSFSEFNIGEGRGAYFANPAGVKTIFSRVTGSNPSNLLGTLGVLGEANLFFLNPNGILFGPNASLDLKGSFVASTASSITFSEGRQYSAINPEAPPLLTVDVPVPIGLQFEGQQPGAIVNAGKLEVEAGQNLTLAGGTVASTGELLAPTGEIAVVAVPGVGAEGEMSVVQLARAGQVLSQETKPLPPESNPASSSAVSLPEVIMEWGENTGLGVNSEGQVELAESGTQVPTDAGTAIVSGRLDASSLSPGQVGGTVKVLGEKVGLLDRAEINVAGDAGGGTALIGGDFQGRGAVPNAARTFIGSDVTVNADALTSGNGGSVIAWADEVMGFYGSISARGGSEAGDGGLAEVSGKQNLIFRGRVDTSAIHGNAGTLLFDPTDIVIASGTGDGAADGEDTFAGNNAGIIGSILSTPLSAIDDAAPTTIYESELEGLAGDTNVVLQATNNITVEDLADDELNFAAGEGLITLTADADGDGVGSFVMEDTEFDTFKTNGRNIAISGASLTLGNIDTSFVSGGELIAVDVDAGGSIPETGTSGTAIFTFTVPELGEPIDDLDMRFSAAHTYDSDLDISLTSPEGTVFQLFSGVGGADDNFQDTLLDDEAATSIANGEAPFNGTFSPTGARGLAVFDGEKPAGTWTLTVTDNAQGDFGTLYRAGEAAPWGTAIGTQLLFRTPLTGDGDSGSMNLTATNGSINAGNLNTANPLGAGSSITLNATDDIDLNDVVNASGGFGDGGSIALTASGNISTEEITSSAEAIINMSGSEIGDIEVSAVGGAIILSAEGDISTGELNSSALARAVANASSDTGDGGLTRNVIASAQGGTINLYAGGDIKTAQLDSSAGALAGAGAEAVAGDGGQIGDVNASAQGGTITLTAGRDIKTAQIDSPAGAFPGSFAGDGGQIGDLDALAQGGTINLTAGRDILTAQLDSSAGALADADVSTRTWARGFFITKANAVTGDGGQTLDVDNLARGGAINLSAGRDIVTAQLTAQAKTFTFVGASVLAEVNATGAVEANASAGDGGQIGDLDALAQGGTINLTAGRDIVTALLDSSAEAVASPQASVFAEVVATSAEVEANASAGDGGHIGDVNASAQGGTINLYAGRDIVTAQLTARAEADASPQASVFAEVVATGAEVEANASAGDGGQIGDVNASAQGGTITLTAEGKMTTQQLDSSALASTDADVSAFTGNAGQTGNVVTLAQGGTIILSAESEISTEDIDSSSNPFTSSGESRTGNGGNVTLIGRTGIFALEEQRINSNTLGDGNAGNIWIEAPSVALTNTEITATASGVGNAGNIFITAEDSVSLDTATRLFTSLEPGARGQGGNITIEANSVSLRNFSFIDTATFGQGDAGDVIVRADTLKLDNSSIFSITSGEGDAGNVLVEASDGVSLTNRSNISTAVNSTAVGDGGNIKIEANSLAIAGGSQLQALTRGNGSSGSIQLNIADAMTASGMNAEGFRSGVFTSSDGQTSGQGGTIEIYTRGNLLVSDGAVLSAQTFSGEASGDILVTANTLRLKNGGQLLTNTFGSGEAGNIIVNTTNGVFITGTDPNFNGQFDPPSVPRERVSVIPPKTIDDIEPNDSTAEAMALVDSFFSINSVQNANTDVELSTRIPYVSISGKGSDPASVDVYLFEVTAGTRGIFDIDNGDSPDSNPEDVNTAIFLFDSEGKLLASNDDAPDSLGAGGSRTESGEDPYLRYAFTEPGTYFIQVDNSLQGEIEKDKTYTLQVSLETPNVAGSVVNSGPASGLFARTESAGAAGSVTMNTPRLIVQDGAEVSASTSSNGQGGSIAVTAPGFITLGGDSKISVETSGAGRAGNVTLTTPLLTVEEQASITATAAATATTSEQGGSITLNSSKMDLFGTVGIFAETKGVVPAGTLTLQPFDNGPTLNVNLQDGAQVSASTSGEGRGGNLRVTAPEAITIRGNGKLSVETSGVGRAGELTIDTKKLSILDEAQVSASTSSPHLSGMGGNVTVDASQSVELSNGARLLAESTGAAPAGNLTIKTRQLTVEEGAAVSAETISSQGGNVVLQDIDSLQVRNGEISASTVTGQAGNLSINADGTPARTVELSGQGGLSVEATEGGTAGNLSVRTQRMSVANGARVTVSSPTGQAGNIDIAANSVSMNQGRITAQTGEGRGEGGANITLELSENLTLSNESLISAEAFDTANGGNVSIDNSRFVIVMPPEGANGSDIIAKAFEGDGGRIDIDAISIFGIEERRAIDGNQTNDFDASSEFGAPGEVNLNTQFDPSRGLTTLPDEPRDPEVTEGCQASSGQDTVQFYDIGRGGSPPRPDEPLNADTLITDWIPLDSEGETGSEAAARDALLSDEDTQEQASNPDDQAPRTAQTTTTSPPLTPPCQEH